MSRNATSQHALFLEQRTALLAFLYGLVGDWAEAEDVAQEVYLAWREAGERGAAIADAGKWCRAVGRNLVFQQWRERKRLNARTVRAVELLDLAFEEAAPVNDGVERERAALRLCLDGLQPQARELLERRYARGEEITAIATAMQRTRAAIDAALSRVRQALRRCVEHRLHDPA